MDKKYFDRIYCLSLSDVQERQSMMKKSLSEYFPQDDVKFWETVHKPLINNRIAQAIIDSELAGQNNYKTPYIETEYYKRQKEFPDQQKNIMGTIFDCAFNVYSILKVSEALGHDHICIFEDDFRFIREKDVFYNYLDKMPEDYDLIRFYSAGFTEEWQKTIDENFKDSMYIPYKHSMLGLNYGGIGMLALSKNGIKVYIDFLETQCFVSDLFLMHPSYALVNNLNIELNAYFPNKVLYYPDYLNQEIKSEVLSF